MNFGVKTAEIWMLKNSFLWLKLLNNQTVTDRIQDCCKKLTLNPGFCYLGCKKVINFESFKVEWKKNERKKKKKIVENEVGKKLFDSFRLDPSKIGVNYENDN